MLLLKLFIFLSPVLRGSASCEPTEMTATSQPADTELTESKLRIQKYEQDLNASRRLQKEDKQLMVSWADEYQIKRLRATMKHRLLMVRHQEHSLRSNGNVQWAECLFMHKREIRRAIKFYDDNEYKCLKTSSSKDAETKEQVELWEKQIVKWRKGYRYLINLCKGENSKKEMARQCLIEHMQNDRYDELIQRLMLLKQGAMNDLQAYFDSTQIQLEECLRSQLSRYVDRMRSLLVTLKKCYKLNT